MDKSATCKSCRSPCLAMQGVLTHYSKYRSPRSDQCVRSKKEGTWKGPEQSARWLARSSWSWSRARPSTINCSFSNMRSSKTFIPPIASTMALLLGYIPIHVCVVSKKLMEPTSGASAVMSNSPICLVRRHTMGQYCTSLYPPRTVQACHGLQRHCPFHSSNTICPTSNLVIVLEP